MTTVDTRRTDFATQLERLSRASVDKHFDAYADVDWDSPEMEIHASDPRWELSGKVDPLGATAWYRAQPPEVRSRIGLHRVAATMRVGWEFENVLQRGLLERAFWMPNFRPEFRYLHHEIVEESHHTMMFQEFINRSGIDAKGIPLREKLISRLTVRMARRLPAMFFFFVLGGEDPVDHLQRRQLREGITHPLAEQIIRIHITEEARHLSFARGFLTTHVPELGRIRRGIISVVVPIMLGVMARMMVQTPRSVRRAEGIPRRVLREANRTPEGRALLRDCVAKTRRLCEELGLVTRTTRRLWDVMGIGAAA